MAEGDRLWPEILPGGEAVLFTIGGRPVETSLIAVLSIDSGETKVLVRGGSNPRYAPTGHIVYGVDGTLRAVSFDLDELEVTSDPVPVLESEGEYVTRSVFFAFGSADLRPESTPELERIRFMIEDYGRPVVIAGHTDSIGSDDYNLDLSAQRADAVKAYLVGRGIGSDLVETVGRGETEPIGDNSTDQGRQANRRVAIVPQGT